MRRKLTLKVKDRAEFEAIQRGLSDPVTLATVKVVGYLMPLSDRSKRRTMNFVADTLAEQAEADHA